MHKLRRGVAFYVETVLLLLFLLLSLTVLVRMLGTARQLSREARQLSCAVRIAQDAAEQLAASDSREDFAALLGARQAEDGTLIQIYDAQGAPAGGAPVSHKMQAANGAQAPDGAQSPDGAPAEDGAQSPDGAPAEDGAQSPDGAQASGTAQAAYSLLCRVEETPHGPGILLTAHFTVCNEDNILYELDTQKYLRG